MVMFNNGANAKKCNSIATGHCKRKTVQSVVRLNVVFFFYKLKFFEIIVSLKKHRNLIRFSSKYAF